MEYKTEVFGNSRVLHHAIYDKMSHPNQAIRKSIDKVVKKTPMNYFLVYVMNSDGELWVHGVEREVNGYRAYPINHDYKNKADVTKVFSGMRTIHSLIK